MANTKITADVIEANAVLAVSIADENITSAKLADLAVTEGKIANDAITAGKIATDAVIAAKIQNGAITSAKLDTNIAVAGTLGVTGATTMTGLTVDGEGRIEETGAAARFVVSRTDALNTAATASVDLLEGSAGGSFGSANNYGFSIDLDGSTNTLNILSGNQTAIKKRLSVTRDTGNISFYEDTGTTAKMAWDPAATRLTLDGAETSRSSNTYLLDIDNSVQTSNLATSGPFRLKGYYGDSMTINGRGDVSLFNEAGAAKFFWDASAESLGIGTTAAYGDRLAVVPATTPTTIAAAKQIQIGEATSNSGYRMQLGYYADPTNSYQSSIQNYAGGNPQGSLVLQALGGKVGIGTTGPAAKLDVRQGTIHEITGLFYNNTGTNAACLKVLQDGAGSSGPALLVRQDGSGNAITVDSVSDGNTVFSVSYNGALSKASGSFKINHPLEAKTDTHHLVHSFIEGPQADNIYRGKVDLVAGSATANIDTVAGMTEGTFVALNREVQCFTTNESNWDAVKGSVSGNILTIESENSESTATISWLVIGERKDQHMYDTDWTDDDGKVIVEPLKTEETPQVNLENA